MISDTFTENASSRGGGNGDRRHAINRDVLQVCRGDAINPSIWHTHTSLRYRAAKRTADLIGAALLLFLLTPVILVVAIAVRLDSAGPAIFQQSRIGKDGKPFRIYKFRTMTWSPDQPLIFLPDGRGGLTHKVRNDHRVTRVGKHLRKTSLDEIPQIINILRGEMSFIGPRPELVEIVAQYEFWQHRRHIVRPGITGLWQVSGRSDKPMHEHTEIDIEYIETMSFRVDARILKDTVLMVLRGVGAF